MKFNFGVNYHIYIYIIVQSQSRQIQAMPKTFKQVIEQSMRTDKSYNPEELRYSDQRLKVIEKILQSMKLLNQKYLQKYLLTDKWLKIESGLMAHGQTVTLSNLVEFKICESNKWENTYFNPFVKKPITICYNKFDRKELFNQAIDYNMILYYDHKTKKNINWNDLEDTTLAHVRALHMSGICQKDDKKCFEKELQRRVFDKERFKGKVLQNYEKVLKKGINDTTPLTQIKFIKESL